MWNSSKYAAMAIAGLGLAAATATPAAAQCGAYGAAYGGYPAYAGVYSYGWPYATFGLAGYGLSGTYGYAGGCGGYYGAAYSGWGTGYGYYGWAPSYGYYPGYYGAAYGCGRSTRHPRGDGYAVAYRFPAGRAVAEAPSTGQSRITYRVRGLTLVRAD